MRNARLFLLLLSACAPALLAQCADTRINEAFQTAWQRRPTANECNAARYAQGDFRATSDLVPLVKAAMVCQDPWIAQAYYRLGKRLNNHDPLQLDNVATTYFSTKGDCDPSQYGSWSSFTQLVGLVQNPPRKTAPPPPSPYLTVMVSGLQVQLNPKGPLVNTLGQLINAAGAVVNDPSHHYYIDSSNYLKVANVVAAGAGNVVAAGAGNVVAAGAGNVVAAGAGNVVAAGAGNVVAAGAGNVVAIPNCQLATAPDRVIRGLSPDGYLIDTLGIRVLQAGSGLRLDSNKFLVNYSNQPLVTTAGLKIVSPDGGTFTLGNSLPNLNVNPVINPGAISNVIAIDPSRLKSLPLRSGYSLKQVTYTVSSFSPASTSWRNKTPQSFSWRAAGTGQVTVRLILAGTSSDLCPAVSVTLNSCQLQPVDWNLAIRSASNATLALVDPQSGNVLKDAYNRTLSTTVMIAVP